MEEKVPKMCVNCNNEYFMGGRGKKKSFCLLDNKEKNSVKVRDCPGFEVAQDILDRVEL